MVAISQVKLGNTGGNAAGIKEHNRTLVVELIVREGPISRSEVAKKTGLTKAAITTITTDLLGYGIIKEIGHGESIGGRRPILLDISEAYQVVIADLSGTTVRVGLSTLRGDISRLITRPLSHEHHFTVNDLLIMLKDAVRAADESHRSILGIGVAVPGLVDYEQGIVLKAVQLGWENVPLKREIEQHFNIPVCIEREINAALLGEQWFGDARLFDNLVYVALGSGIGISVMANGALLSGKNRLAGEFGHTVVHADGPLCKCGNRGCLESVASMSAMIERAKEAFFEGQVDDVFARVVESSNGQIDLESVLAAAAQQSPTAAKIMDEAARYLGIGLANLVNIFDPEAILIGSSVPALPSYQGYLESALATMDERILDERQRRPQVLISRFQERVRLLGMTAVVLTQLLHDWSGQEALVVAGAVGR